jgi:hypothetical protein
MICYPPDFHLPTYPEREPIFPGSAFSLCHHVPSRPYRDCETCQEAFEAWRARRNAWWDLSAIFAALAWLFERQGEGR